MRIAILLLITLALSVSAILPRHKRADIEQFTTFHAQAQEFNSWKQQHNKVYTSFAEEVVRFQNFKNSVVRIAERNAKAKNTVFGLNKFSDYTPEEFKKLLGYVPQNSTFERSILPNKGGGAVPSTYDWRNQKKVTPVKDQGQCGSCWAFSVVENIESIWMIAKGITGDQMKPLSEQEIVDCDSSDSGCSGGDPPTAYAYVISAGGLETEADYPYTASNDDCSFDKSKVAVTISDWKYATQSQDESEMQTALINWGPLSICVDAEPWQDYSQGILASSDCGRSLDHCVQAVGYDMTNTTPFWSVRNSWGSDWGEDGYIRLEYGRDTCGMADEATSSVV